MKLEALQLQNFRSLAPVRLDGLPQFTILTGFPGAGRIVLAAIEALLTGRCSPELLAEADYAACMRASFLVDQRCVRHGGMVGLDSISILGTGPVAVRLTAFIRGSAYLQVHESCERHPYSGCHVRLREAHVVAILGRLNYAWSGTTRAPSELFLRSQVAFHSSINFFTLDVGDSLSAVAALLPWPPGQQVILAADATEAAADLPGAQIIRLEAATVPVGAGFKPAPTIPPEKGGAASHS